MSKETIEEPKNYFEVLNSVNLADKIEKKSGLSYVSWSFSWGELKKRHPDAFYTIYENPDGWNYFHDGRTAWVKTGVTVNGIEHIEYLPVMDFKNKSIPLDNITSMDVNKAIQRSLTKACARHGLGLYVYAGEDLPEDLKDAGDEIITENEVQVLKAMCVRKGKPTESFNGKPFDQITAKEYATAVRGLSKLPDRE